jgi:hypothetical protein
VRWVVIDPAYNPGSPVSQGRALPPAGEEPLSVGTILGSLPLGRGCAEASYPREARQGPAPEGAGGLSLHTRHWPIAERVERLDLAWPGARPQPIARSAVAQAHARLGEEPLKWLLEKSAVAWVHASARRHAWRKVKHLGEGEEWVEMQAMRFEACVIRYQCKGFQPPEAQRVAQELWGVGLAYNLVRLQMEREVNGSLKPASTLDVGKHAHRSCPAQQSHKNPFVAAFPSSVPASPRPGALCSPPPLPLGGSRKGRSCIFF